MDTGAPVDTAESKVRSSRLVVMALQEHISLILYIPSFPYFHLHCDELYIQEEEDYDVMQDPEFLQSVLENLPGVDPNNEAIRNAMGSLASQSGNKQEGKKHEEKKK